MPMKGYTVITLSVFKVPPDVLLFLYSSGILEKVPDLFNYFAVAATKLWLKSWAVGGSSYLLCVTRQAYNSGLFCSLLSTLGYVTTSRQKYTYQNLPFLMQR